MKRALAYCVPVLVRRFTRPLLYLHVSLEPAHSWTRVCEVLATQLYTSQGALDSRSLGIRGPFAVAALLRRAGGR